MWKIILAAIAGIILLILFLRVKVVVEAPDDLRLTLYVGLFRMRLIPKKDERLKLKDWSPENYRKKLAEDDGAKNLVGKIRSSIAKLHGKKKKPGKSAGKQTSTAEKTEEETDLGGLIEKITRVAKVFITRLGKHLRIDFHTLRITVASEDAARTAVTYGVVIGAVQNLWALLVSTGNLHTYRKSVLSVDTDFTKTEPEVEVKLGFSLRVWQMTDILFRAALEYLKEDETDNDENSGQTPDRINTNKKGDQKNGREQAHRNNPGVARTDKAGR